MQHNTQHTAYTTHNTAHSIHNTQHNTTPDSVDGGADNSGLVFNHPLKQGFEPAQVGLAVAVEKHHVV